MVQGFSVNSTYLSYTVCRGTVVFTWLYHGLVPKLLYLHEDKLAMSMAAGLSQAGATQLAIFGGVLEIVMAIVVLVFWRQRWPLFLTVAAMIGLLVFVTLVHPILLGAAFNPLTTNLPIAVLALVSLHLLRIIEG